MDIKSLAEQYNDYIIDRRRYYHTCPELSGEEKNTRAHLKEDLEALGITDIHEMETCYGLTATIHGGKPGKRRYWCSACQGGDRPALRLPQRGQDARLRP